MSRRTCVHWNGSSGGESCGSVPKASTTAPRSRHPPSPVVAVVAVDDPGDSAAIGVRGRDVPNAAARAAAADLAVAPGKRARAAEARVDPVPGAVVVGMAAVEAVRGLEVPVAQPAAARPGRSGLAEDRAEASLAPKAPSREEAGCRWSGFPLVPWRFRERSKPNPLGDSDCARQPSVSAPGASSPRAPHSRTGRFSPRQMVGAES